MLIRKLFFATALLGAQALSGDSVDVGVLSFNALNPGSGGSPGVNDFEIDNLTGPIFSLPPDFPLIDSVTFGGLQLSLTGSEGMQTVTVGDTGPGFNTPSSLQFLDSTTFSEVVLQATLSQTSFTLSDGTMFLADSNSLVATLNPSAGPSLIPGVDFVLLSVSGSVTSAVPEPYGASFMFIIAFIPILWTKRLGIWRASPR
jgi:hypothetical protein